MVVPLSSADEGVPGARPQRVNVDPCSGAPRTNNDPAVGRAAVLSTILEEVLPEILGQLENGTYAREHEKWDARAYR